MYTSCHIQGARESERNEFNGEYNFSASDQKGEYLILLSSSLFSLNIMLQEMSLCLIHTMVWKNKLYIWHVSNTVGPPNTTPALTPSPYTSATTHF